MSILQRRFKFKAAFASSSPLIQPLIKLNIFILPFTKKEIILHYPNFLFI